MTFGTPLWGSIVETAEDMDQGDQSEELISEQTLLDTVDVPGLPQQEADRRAAWH